MQADRWRQVEEIFHSALELDRSARPAFVAHACCGNEDLILEVESLISAFEHNPEMMSNPALGLGLEVIHKNSSALPADRRIGNYELIRKLGGGGMGDVFLAEDLKLNRKVALKFLANYFTDDSWAKRRLVREAQAAALLDHPNICAIHGLEAVEDKLFIVMQYVEGPTLAELMSEGGVRRPDILPMIIQIAEAISAAHSKGIVHRDIKPGNIMVGQDGKVKVLDFGLAKKIENLPVNEGDYRSEVSQSGLILGTVAYMSPEQLRAEEIDYRSDVFSLGIVMYELLSGRHPFAQPSQAETISSILVTEPDELTPEALAVPVGMTRIVETCLNKDKEQRFPHGSALLKALQDLEGHPIAKATWRSGGLPHLVVVVTLLLLLLSATAWIGSPQPHRVAVLPFVNESGDSQLEFIAGGLTEDLIARFSKHKDLKVRPFTKVYGYKVSENDPTAIGRELEVQTVLFGSIIQQGKEFILRTTLIDVDRSSIIKITEKPIDPTNVLVLQNELSESALEYLSPWWRRLLVEGLAEGTMRQPSNSSAFKLYLQGRHYWKKRDKANIQLATEAFQKAIDADPTFAPAHAGLADSYVLLSSVAYGSVPTKEVMTKAKAAARNAIEIDPGLCDSHSALGVVQMKYEWNWVRAEESFRKAIELDPDYAPAHYWLSGLLAVTGRSAESIAEAEIARTLDPFSPLGDINLARAYYYARRYDEALVALRSGSREHQEDAKNRYMAGLILIQKGAYDQAIEFLRPIYEANKVMGGAALGFAYARNGNLQAARHVLDELNKIGSDSHLPPQEKAILYLGLKEWDNAFHHLEEAYTERYAPLISIRVEPLYDGLRLDRRYSDLVTRMSLNTQD